MKKIRCVAVAVLLCICLSLSAAAESAQIKTTVPSIHSVSVRYNEGGTIVYQGVPIASETVFTVERFGSAVMGIVCNPDSHLKSVTVNGEDGAELIKGGILTLTDIHTDTEVVFTFQKCEDVGKGDPDDPDYDPDEKDHCTTIEMVGKVYYDEDEMPDARLELDFGKIGAVTDKKGNYEIEKIKDGYHTVKIYDKNGEVAGESDFSIEISESAVKITILRLTNGTQLITVPEGTDRIRLNFIVHSKNNEEDTTGGGTGDLPPEDDKKDNIEIVIGEDEVTPPEPTTKPKEPTTKPAEPTTEPSKPSKPSKIPSTGLFLAENPAILGTVTIALFFIILLPIFKRRKKEQEEQEQQ